MVPGGAGKLETADRVIFLGSRSLINGAGKNAKLRWHWRLGEHELKAGTGSEKIAALLRQASCGEGIAAAEFYRGLTAILGDGEAEKAWRTLREGGLTLGIVLC
jgi:hypothetical protein